jgi:hypothetical protein
MESSSALPLATEKDKSDSAETTPQAPQAVQWEVVARMPGLTPAQILVGRLQSEGIPARAYQEAGGAIGVTVGLLGIGYVAVPEEYAKLARAILADEEE